MKRISIVHFGSALLALTAALALTVPDDVNEKDHAAVKQAVLNYVNAFYEAKPELIEQSIHPDLVKYGYAYNARSDAWQGTAMTFEQAKELAAEWNAAGRLPADAPKKIKVHDVRERTASASLDAAWGMDHFHLAKVDGTWKILHVLWQSTPDKGDE